MFNDEFINSLSDDPVEGVVAICDRIMEFHASARGAIDKYDMYIEAYAFLASYLEVNKLPTNLANLSQDKAQNIAQFVNSVGKIHSIYELQIDTQSVDHLKSKFQAKLKGGFCYEFTEGDLSRIQQLVNDLRDLVSNYPEFEEEHRQRLLRRLEKLQSELHKKVSDLDRFWGLIGDAGVVLGKFGDDAKPFVDRIKEIADIVWRTQSKTEELPSGTKSPLLTNDGDENT